MAEYEVTAIDGTTEWSSQYGPMISWALRCKNLQTGRIAACEINAKPGGKQYNVGDTFEADVKGQRAGVYQLKRLQPQDGRGGGNQYRGSSQGSGRAQTGSTGQREALPFDRAVLLLEECIRAAAAIGGTPEHGTTLYLGVTRGDIAWPPLEAQRDSNPFNEYVPPDPFEDDGNDGPPPTPF